MFVPDKFYKVIYVVIKLFSCFDWKSGSLEIRRRHVEFRWMILHDNK